MMIINILSVFVLSKFLIRVLIRSEKLASRIVGSLRHPYWLNHESLLVLVVVDPIDLT